MQLTPRERMLALVQERELDRVPFVVYNGVLPTDEVIAHLGAERVGRLIWCRVHRVEHPHCHFDFEEYFVGESKWRRNTLHTPGGVLTEERAYEPTYGTSSIRKHYVQEAQDYKALWALLEDSIILENHAQYHADQATLGDYGLPLVAVERTPYQQLWVQWVGLDNLSWHLADCPERVARTVEMLRQRERRVMEIAARSPAPFIDFPDNITAPTIGLRRFQEYCVPLYDELADMIAKIAGIEIVKKHVPGPQGVRGRNSDNTRLRRVLGWEPEISLEEGLLRTYMWIEEQVRHRLELN